MRLATKQLWARVQFLYEERCLLHAGTCSCSRPRDRLDTPELRKAMDELNAAIADEPTTIDASRFSRLEAD
jgi:hypothetical protein